MRRSALTIPSTFQKLDDTLATTNEFADCRTFAKRYLNHNVLLAQSIRKQILTQAYPPLVVKGWQPRSTTTSTPAAPPVVFEGPLLINQGCQYLTIKVRGCQSAIAGGTANDPKLVFILYRPGERKSPEDYGLTLTVTTAYTAVEADLGNFSGDIAVPMAGASEHYKSGRRCFVLGVYCLSKMVTDATVSSGATLHEVDEDGVSFRGALSAEVGSTLHFSDLAIAPTRIVGYSATSGKYRVYPPLLKLPTEGADTVTTREVVGVNIHSLSIYEKIVTDFSAVHGKV